MNESPKYLKRNHKVSNLPYIDPEGQKSCEYLKNKVFLTFDYSYYQNIPKTASMYIGKRINNLSSLIQHEQNRDGREGSVSHF